MWKPRIETLVMTLLHDNEVRKYCRHSFGLVHVGILVNRHKKSRNEEKASGTTRYDPSELYNALDTIVALEESSADASFFQAKICFTFGRIFLYKRKFILKRVRKWLIHHYAAYVLRTYVLPSTLTAYLILDFITRPYLLFLPNKKIYILNWRIERTSRRKTKAYFSPA